MHVIVRTFLAASVITAFLSSGQATALEVYANSGPGTSGIPISGTAEDRAVSLAQGFKTGGNGYYTPLESVQIAFNFPDLRGQGITPDDYLKIELYSSTGTAPNNLIGSFNPQPVEAFDYVDSIAYTFNFSGGPIKLQKNTEYWVVVSSDTLVTDAIFTWGFAAGSPPESAKPTVQNDSGYSYVGTVGTFADLSGWQDISGGPGSIATASGLRFGVIIVPEPSTYALGIAGTLVMGAIARRKSRKAVKA